jgi:hypothetical protein
MILVLVFVVLAIVVAAAVVWWTVGTLRHEGSALGRQGPF